MRIGEWVYALTTETPVVAAPVLAATVAPDVSSSAATAPAPALAAASPSAKVSRWVWAVEDNLTFLIRILIDFCWILNGSRLDFEWISYAAKLMFSRDEECGAKMLPPGFAFRSHRQGRRRCWASARCVSESWS